MQADAENMRAIWEWAVAHGQMARLGQALEGLSRFYVRRSRFLEGEAACRVALEGLAAQETLPLGRQDGRVRGRLLVWQGSFCFYLGRLEAAGHLLRQGLDLLESRTLTDVDTRVDRAWASAVLGAVARDSGDLNQLEKLNEQSLALYRSAGDLWGTAIALGDSALLALYSDDYNTARRRAEESLALRRRLGDAWGIGNTLVNLGKITRSQGELEASEAFLREAIAVHEEIDHRGLQSAGMLNVLSRTLCRRGKFAEACKEAEKALARQEDTGARTYSVTPRVNLGTIKLHQGHYEEARGQLLTGLDLSRELGLRMVTGASLVLLGYVALSLETYAEARQFAQECISLAQAFEFPRFQSWAFILSGYLSHRLGEPARTGRYLHEALLWVFETRNADLMVEALPAVALLWAGRGHMERAVELYALASRHPFVANSCWFEDVAGAPISAVAATLPPQVVAAAQERGRARDLWDTAAELVEELKPVTIAADIVGLRVESDDAAGLRHGARMPASENGGRSSVGDDCDIASLGTDGTQAAGAASTGDGREIKCYA
jgi:tetratricopeptide (TPR) repeat protein